jgi:glutathione S-transferase
MITGVDYIEKIITLSKGEHITPEYTLINPNQSVPAI